MFIRRRDEKKDNMKIKDFFDIKKAVKEEEIKGEIPSSKKMYKDYINLAWPAAMEGLLINLISSADLMMVGRAGLASVAAVGIVSQPKYLLMSFCRAIGIAVTAIVARRKGEHDSQGIHKCVKQAFLINLLIYVLTIGTSLIFSKELLVFAGARSDYLKLAQDYFFYVAIGLFFTSVSQVIASAHIGLGDTKIVFYSNIVGNIANIIINFFLIQGRFGFPQLGVVGAGIGTTIGNFITFVMLMYSTTSKTSDVSLRGKDNWKFEKEVVKPLKNLSFSAFSEQIFERIGLFLYTKFLAELGTLATATHHICIMLCDIYYFFGVGMGTASAALTGQKLGEKREDLAIMYGKVGQRIGYVVSVFFCVFFVIFRRELLSLFVSDPNVINLGANIMLILAACTFVQTQALVTSGILRGAGDNKFVASYSFIVIALFRPMFTWILLFRFNLGLYGVWIALITDQSLRMIISKIRFNSGKWKGIQL